MSRKTKSTAKSGVSRGDSHAGAATIVDVPPPRWLTILNARPWLTLALLTAVCLLPFVGKPFHVDDPMYIWAGEHIRSHPFDPYGFSVYWTGNVYPMPVVMQNPPLASYYIALVSAATGMSEVAMHLAFFVPALLLMLGTYTLARPMCSQPVLAAAMAAITPAFVISGTTVMSDIIMTCFWVWAVVLWDRGLRAGNWRHLAAAGVLIGLGFLTKYPAINVIPLLAAYTLVRRASWKYLLFLLIPVAFVVAYESITLELYGRRLFSAAGWYSSVSRARRGVAIDFKIFTSLTFSGGCLLPAMLIAPLVWRLQTLMIGVAVSVGVLILLTSAPPEWLAQRSIDGRMNWSLAIQAAIWATAGVNVLALTAADVWKRRNAESALLALWIFGTFVFAGLMNWSVNGRSILPMAPAVAIVIVRRLEDASVFARPTAVGYFTPAALAASLALSMVLAAADYVLAGIGREAANDMAARFSAPGGRGALLFQGHWGFQHYMQQRGAQPFEWLKTPLKEGDLVVTPLFNTNVTALPPEIFTEVDVLYLPPLSWVTTMNRTLGAGFYSDSAGPLPFLFGAAPMEQYQVTRVEEAFDPEKYRGPASAQTQPTP